MNKYNNWCERKPLVSPNMDDYFNISAKVNFLPISSLAKDAIFQHEFLNCDGLEFVIFTSVKIRDKIDFQNGLIIVPCFRYDTAGLKETENICKTSTYMAKKSMYIYDGWLEIDCWEHKNVENRIEVINKSLSLFSFFGDVQVKWEPKYSVKNGSSTTILPSTNDILFLKSLNNSIENEMTKKDISAFYRSTGWLAQAGTNTDVFSKFLFYMLSLESMIDYIEQKASEDSVFNELKTVKLSKSEKRIAKEKCIKHTLEVETDLIKAVEYSYFNCNHSIKTRMKNHLKIVFSDDPHSLELLKFLFTNKIDGKTLYQIRSNIAHGSADTISLIQKDAIASRIYDIERITKRYLRRISMKFEKVESPEKIYASMNFNLGDNVLTSESMYCGPIRMDEYYYNRI